MSGAITGGSSDGYTIGIGGVYGVGKIDGGFDVGGVVGIVSPHGVELAIHCEPVFGE